MSESDEIKSLMSQYESLLKQKKASEDTKKVTSEQMEKLEARIIDSMVDMGVQNIKSESGYLFFRKKQKYVNKHPGADKDALAKALANSPQFSDLVSLSYNTMSLRKRYNEVIDNGDEVDPSVQEMLSVTEVVELGVRSS